MSPITRIGGGIQVASRGLVLGEGIRMPTVVGDGPATLFTDSFVGTADSTLVTHTSDSGHAWAVHPVYSANAGHIVIAGVGPGIRHSTTGTPQTSASIVPALAGSADYDITFDYHVFTNVGSCGVLFRYSDTADTGYLFRISGTAWAILRADAGVFTGVGTANTFSPVNGTTYAMKIECRDATKRVLRNAVEITTTTDNTHTAKGRIGTRYTNISMTDTTGIHIRNLVVTEV